MKKKSELKRDTVNSQSFHVGIELELMTPCENVSHDDDACNDNQREYLEGLSAREILRDHFSLDRTAANMLELYFDTSQWVDDEMNNFTCEDSECCFYRGNADELRDDMRRDLVQLTGNTSFKIVEDGSINTSDDNTDTEVCWNYFASKETVKDNERILSYLKDKDCSFDKSCGLHINLNNYLNLPHEHVSINTNHLSFLFRYVAESREDNSYCNRYSVSSSDKYSMIYNQGDRLEFRFFSPTLEAEKLNAYVSLAHFVYKRLAGKRCKMPKHLENYLMEKMTKVNGHSHEDSASTIWRTNNLPSLKELIEIQTGKIEEKTENETLTEAVESLPGFVYAAQLPAQTVECPF